MELYIDLPFYEGVGVETHLRGKLFRGLRLGSDKVIYCLDLRIEETVKLSTVKNFFRKGLQSCLSN